MKYAEWLRAFRVVRVKFKFVRLKSNCEIALRNAGSLTTNADADTEDNAGIYWLRRNAIKKLHFPSQENAALKNYENLSSQTIDILLLKFLTHKIQIRAKTPKITAATSEEVPASNVGNTERHQLSLSTRSRRAREVFRGRDQLRCYSAHKSCWDFASCALSGRTRRYL